MLDDKTQNQSDYVIVNRLGYTSDKIRLPIQDRNQNQDALVQKYYEFIGKNILEVQSPAEAVKKFGSPLKPQYIELDPLPEDAPEYLKNEYKELQERQLTTLQKIAESGRTKKVLN